MYMLSILFVVPPFAKDILDILTILISNKLPVQGCTILEVF